MLQEILYGTVPEESDGAHTKSFRSRNLRNRFFIRMQVSNEPGVLAAIAKVFGDHKVSIERVIQEQAKAAKAELVIGTSAVKEYHLQDALEELKEMPIVSEISSIIREY